MSDWPDIVDDTAADAHAESAPRPEDDDRLRRRHIAAVIAEKRAVERRRTYRRIATAVAVVSFVQAAWSLFCGSPRTAAAAVIVGVVGMLIGMRLRPPDAPLAPETLPPPDFTGLGDGSHFARNLDALATPIEAPSTPKAP